MTDPQLVGLAQRYVASLQLLSDLPLIKEYRIREATLAEFDIYRSVHTDEYVNLLEQIYRESKIHSSIPLEALAFERIGVGGTLMATRLALSEQCMAYHLGGGYHHGMPDRPNGIDYANDVAIALAYILSTGVKRILYVDLDVHHPDGVQGIFAGESRILQISLHGWPTHTREGHYSYIGVNCGRGKNINMPLPPHCGDYVYLRLLKAILTSVMRNYQPEIVFYQAGVDAHHSDPIGCLNLSLRGLYDRDRFVASICMRKTLPLIIVLGGGYHSVNSPRAIINTLAAFAGKQIEFDEPESVGDSSAAKAFRWYDSLRVNLQHYIELDPITESE